MASTVQPWEIKEFKPGSMPNPSNNKDLLKGNTNKSGVPVLQNEWIMPDNDPDNATGANNGFLPEEGRAFIPSKFHELPIGGDFINNPPPVTTYPRSNTQPGSGINVNNELSPEGPQP